MAKHHTVPKSGSAFSWSSLFRRIHLAVRSKAKPAEAPKRTLLQQIGNIASIVLIAVLSLLLVISVTSVFLKKNTSVAGQHFYIVMSTSMTPAVTVGSLVAVRDVAPETLQVGDIITFMSPGTTELITHRITMIDTGNGLSFTTRGDANPDNDRNAVPAENIVGKVSFHLKGLGYLIYFLHTWYGFSLLVILPCLLWLYYEFHLYRKRKRALPDPAKPIPETEPHNDVQI